MMALAALVLLLVLLLAEVPAFVAIGLVASGLLLIEGNSFSGLAQIVLDHLNSSSLTALPFFIIAAAFLERGGLARALVDLSLAWLGRLRGGLAFVTVAAGSAFSTLSGSSVATAMAMGTVLAPEMERRGYPRPFSLGLIGTTGTLGILVPPSMALILFGVLTGESISKLFLAGIIPGAIQALLLVATILMARRPLALPRGESLDLSSRLRDTRHGLPALVLILCLFTAIYGGFVTVTEAAAMTAIFAILLSIFVYRGCHIAEVPAIIADGLANAARVLLIVGSALLLSHWLTSAGIAESLVKTLTELGLQRWQFLLAINLILLLIGIVLEGVSSLLVVVPLIAPLLKPMGIDPLHFAIIMVVNLEIGLLHPPLGMNIFVLSSIGNCSTAEVIRGLWPFLAMMFVLLLVVTVFPGLSTWLPMAIYGN